MIIFSVLTFQGTDTVIEFIDPVDPVCPSDNNYEIKGNFCYASGCEMSSKCDKVSVTCPLGTQVVKDGKCYTLVQYSDPVEPECPEGHVNSGDICLPEDATIDEHETRKTSLRCMDGRVLRNYRCFVMSELIEEPCQKKKSLDNTSNTCDANSNKSEETFTGKCSKKIQNNEEQVSFNNKCYKENRINVAM